MKNNTCEICNDANYNRNRGTISYCLIHDNNKANSNSFKVLLSFPTIVLCLLTECKTTIIMT